jgi:serine/threonine protein kinase
MEMIKSGQLKEFIDMRQAKKRPITDEEASVIMKNILSAVQYMHSKEIIHRDLKPGMAI